MIDREDRLFIKEVGSKAVRVLKQRNIRLWLAFKDRCRENAENPEIALGRMLFNFTKSILDGDEAYATEILDKTVKVSALTRRSSIEKDIESLVKLREMLKSSGTDTTDRLINDLLDKAFKSTASPMDIMQKEEKIVIDDEFLAQLTPEELDRLASAAMYVKQEKEKLMEMKADELIEEEVEHEEEIEEEDEYSGEDRDSNGGGESSEDVDEGDRGTGE